LQNGNEDAVLSSVKHMIQVANERDIKRILFAGDLFHSRSFQRQSILLTLDKILNLFNENGIWADFIPGNHDKTIYASHDSFLDTFRHYPKFKLHSKMTVIAIDDVEITMLPFFSDDMLIPMLEDADGTDVLISHFEMAGSTHLGRSSEKTSINQKLLSKWSKTYLGHYHNWHEISKDIVHLPSFIQDGFGEDSNKGFSILYDDLSYEIIQGRFKTFNKVSVNIDKVGTKEIKELIELYKNSSNVIRFEFTGDESKLKAIDKSLFNNTGIDVKIKYEVKYDYDNEDLTPPSVVEKYDKIQVRGTFKQFCEDKGLEYNKGIILLDEFLNQI
jgi:DNA repair exonuclease SbcCD nuclease subunit